MPIGVMAGASVPRSSSRLLLQKQQSGAVTLWGLNPQREDGTRRIEGVIHMATISDNGTTSTAALTA